MPSNWIGSIHRGQFGKRWSLRENAYWYDPEGQSCNAGRPEYDMQSLVEILDGTNQRRIAIFCPASETTLDKHGGKIIRNHCFQWINGSADT